MNKSLNISPNKSKISKPSTLSISLITLFLLSILLSSCIVVEKTETPDGKIVEQTRIAGINEVKDSFNEAKTTIKDESIEIQKRVGEAVTCNNNDECGDGYCVFSKCQVLRPDYPVIGEVKIYNSKNQEKVKTEYGDYALNAEELYYFLIKADNKGSSFNIKIDASARFGTATKENTSPNFKDGARQAYYSSISPYAIRVENKEKNDAYPFYFRPLGFSGDEYSVDVYLEDYQKSTDISKRVRIPIKIIQS